MSPGRGAGEFLDDVSLSKSLDHHAIMVVVHTLCHTYVRILDIIHLNEQPYSISLLYLVKVPSQTAHKHDRSTRVSVV